MKRWWLWPIAGVLGVGLAVVVVSRPDTGGEVAKRPERLPRITGNDIPRPGDEDWHPVLVRDGDDGEGDAPQADRSNGPASSAGTEGGNPYSVGMSEARKQPHILALSRASTPWRQVVRLLKAQPDDPTAVEYGEKAQALVDDLRQARRRPYEADYDDFERRQQELISVIRQTQLVDDEVGRALTFAEQIMTDYRAGEIKYEEPPQQQ